MAKISASLEDLFNKGLIARLFFIGLVFVGLLVVSFVLNVGSVEAADDNANQAVCSNFALRCDQVSSACTGFGYNWTSSGYPSGAGNSQCCGDDSSEYYYPGGWSSLGASCGGSCSGCFQSDTGCAYQGSLYSLGSYTDTSDSSNDTERCVQEINGNPNTAVFMDQDITSSYCLSTWFSSASSCSGAGPGGVCDDADGGGFCCGDDPNENVLNGACVTDVAASGQPDLVVGQIGLGLPHLVNPSICAGQSITVYGSIGNVGDARAGSSRATMRVGGRSCTTSVGSINPGTSPAFYNCSLTPSGLGNQSVSVQADSGNAVSESAEDNNFMSSSTNVIDCAVCSQDSDCGLPTSGAWGACSGFSSECVETGGTQSRSVATPRCFSPGTPSASCVTQYDTQSQGCLRNTDGNSCTGGTCSNGSCVSVSVPDTTPPSWSSTSIGAPPPSFPCGVVRYRIFGASDSGSGLHSSPYSFNGGSSWQSSSYKDYPYSGTDISFYGGQVRIRDNAGNQTKFGPTTGRGKVCVSCPADGWYDSGVAYCRSDGNLNQCQTSRYEVQDEEFRDYPVSGTCSNFSVTSTRTTSTGRACTPADKSDGTACSGGTCQGGTCVAPQDPCNNCTSWSNQSCSGWVCSSTERHQTRSCPASCSQPENRCVTDNSCAPPPPPPPTGPVCGDGSCNGTESCSSCSADCGTCPPPPPTGPVCGNSVCEGGESCSSCSADCGTCPPPPPPPPTGSVCGDNSCNGSETCSSCSQDCGTCGPICGNNTCESGESCSSCSADCGTCNGSPNTPSSPSPGSGGSNVSASTSFSWSGGDPDGDPVTYRVYLDGSLACTTTSTNAGNSCMNGPFSSSSSHTWQVIADDGQSTTSGPTWSFEIANNAPGRPSVSGPSVGEVGVSYTFTATASDPDGDQVKYRFDWGDGQSTETSLTASGGSRSASHTWNSSGGNTISVVAIDAQGVQSSPKTHSMSVSLPDFIISADPPSRSANKSKSVTFNVDLTSVFGFNDTVNLTILGLPDRTSAAFSSSSCTPDCSLSLLILTDLTTQAGSYDLTIIASGGGRSHADTVTLSVTTPPTDPPNADFAWCVTEDAKVRFTDTSQDSDGEIVQWNWDFNDGSADSARQHPTHDFNTGKTTLKNDSAIAMSGATKQSRETMGSPRPDRSGLAMTGAKIINFIQGIASNVISSFNNLNNPNSLSNFSVQPVQAQLQPFTESGGLVAMEAENYDSKSSGSMYGRTFNWVKQSSFGDPSGNTYMTALPNIGVRIDSGYESTMPELQYRVNFSTKGTYYVWARANADLLGNPGSEDSVHVGLDGVGLTTPRGLSDSGSGNFEGGFDWANGASRRRVTLRINNAGEHTINFWMREDGFRFDKIVMTDDPGFTPSGYGPSESPRGVPLPEPPRAPDKIKFSSISQTGMVIRWNDRANNEDGYRVYRDGSRVATLGSNNEVYSATGLSCGRRYTWRIEAYNDGGTASASASRSTSSCLPSPTGVTLTVWDNVGATDSISRTVDFLTSCGSSNRPDLIIGDISWSPSSPVDGDRVTLSFKVENQGKRDADSSKLEYFIDNTRLAKLKVKSIRRNRSRTVTASWTATAGSHTVRAVADSDDDIREFNEDNNTKQEVMLVSSAFAANRPPERPTISGPTSGETVQDYTYTARARDPDGDRVQYIFTWNDGRSDVSDFVSSNTNRSFKRKWPQASSYSLTVIAVDEFGAQSPPAILGVSIANPIFNLNTAVLSCSVVGMSWDRVSATNAYEVRRDGTIVATIDDSDPVFCGAFGCAFDDNSVSESTNYSYTVRAQRIDGSTLDNTNGPQNETTPVCAVTGTVASSSACGRIEVGWDSIPGATYLLCRALQPSGNFTPVATNLSANSYVDTSILIGTTYYYGAHPEGSDLTCANTPPVISGIASQCFRSPTFIER